MSLPNYGKAYFLIYSSPPCLPVCEGRHFFPAFEEVDKVGDIVHPGFKGNLSHRHICILEQLFGIRDAGIYQVFIDGDTHIFFEFLGNMETAAVVFSLRVRQREAAAEILVHLPGNFFYKIRQDEIIGPRGGSLHEQFS